MNEWKYTACVCPKLPAWRCGVEDLGSCSPRKPYSFSVAGARMLERPCAHTPASAGGSQEQVFTRLSLGLILFPFLCLYLCSLVFIYCFSSLPIPLAASPFTCAAVSCLSVPQRPASPASGNPSGSSAVLMEIFLTLDHYCYLFS